MNLSEPFIRRPVATSLMMAAISVSLIAVFIPLLLMSGIIGRLFRECALTVTASIVVSAFVSLTLAPMLCLRFMRHRSDRHGRLYRAIEPGRLGLRDSNGAVDGDRRRSPDLLE